MTDRKVLDDRQVAELVSLMNWADAVELKLSVPDSDIRSVGDALGLDPLQAEMRQILFFDTPDLRLNEAGVVVRARRIQGGAGDTVVKLRPIGPEQAGSELFRKQPVGVEIDAMPGGFVCSASLKGKTTAADVRRVALGEQRVRSLFSKQQKAFFAQHAPDGLKLGDLRLLGPINILKLKFNPEGLGHKMVAEVWLYPDGSRVLELSSKCPPQVAFQVAAEVRAYLVERGVDVSGEQHTKTKTALEYFAAALAGSDER